MRKPAELRSGEQNRRGAAVAGQSIMEGRATMEGRGAGRGSWGETGGGAARCNPPDSVTLCDCVVGQNFPANFERHNGVGRRQLKQTCKLGGSPDGECQRLLKIGISRAVGTR